MKKLILMLLLSISHSFAYDTTLELLNQEISKLHNGDEVMEVIQGKQDNVGYYIPFFDALGRINDQLTADNINSLHFNATHDYFGKHDRDWKKRDHLNEKQVKRAIKKLSRNCQKRVKKLNDGEGVKGENYYCSKIYVYTGDIKNPVTEGLAHSANAQDRRTHRLAEVKPGTPSESKTRLALDSNNELLGNYEVYTIAIMRNWN